VEKGVARETDLDAVRVELARAGPQEVEARSTRDADRALRGALGGEAVGDLLKPTPPGEVPAGAGRPELALFRARAEMQESRLGVTLAGPRPRVGLFVQGGYGNPGLNMLENAFTPYYIGGIRLSWDIGSLYTLRGERRQVSLDREMVEVGRDAFLVNLSAETARARSEVEKWRALLDRDDEIIVLRERIAGSAAAGVEGGIVSVSEWTREVNRLDQARQARALHEIQWLLAIYTLNLTRGVL
jgi:outer membrane protein TolC